MADRKRKKRKGTKKEHICPVCSERFTSLKRFAAHIETHDWSETSGEDTSPTHARVEAILLGLASAGIYEFVTWCLEYLDPNLIQRVLGDLFYLNVPMGAGGPSASRVLRMWLDREDLWADCEGSLEEGLYQKMNEYNIGEIDTAITRWLSERREGC